jgi:hypothetical protein
VGTGSTQGCGGAERIKPHDRAGAHLNSDGCGRTLHPAKTRVRVVVVL